MTSPERGEAVGRAAEGDLVPLLAVLIDAEDADVPDVVVAAGIHAAGHLDLDLAQVVEVVEVIEALLDLTWRHRACRRWRAAEIQARAGDHVGERADVGRRQLQRAPARCHSACRSRWRTSASSRFCVWVTRTRPKLKRSARSATASICVGGHVAGDRAVGLERDEHRAVAGHLVGARVVAVPGLEARLGACRRVEVGEDLVGLRPEEGAHALDLGGRQLRPHARGSPATPPRPARGSARCRAPSPAP